MDDKATDKERFDAFVEGMKELVTKTKYNIGASPSFVVNERGTFEVAIELAPVDIKNQGVPSPFVP